MFLCPIWRILLNHHARCAVRRALAIGFFACTTPAFADGESLLSNLRSALDFSSRSMYRDTQTWHVAAAGLDLHSVLSSDRGDIGTLTLQPYLLRIDDAPNPGPLFEDDHDWALQWRIANFNYTGLAQGKLNLRVGHFELPFGLEQIEQTNGTLYQLNSPANVGLKADWGMSLNGVLPQFEYEVAYMLGEGNELSSTRGGQWVGRIGSSSDRRWRVGASFLNGEQQEPVLVQRERYGVDLSYQLGRGWRAGLDVSTGREQSSKVRAQLWQLLWADAKEQLHTYIQWRRSKVSAQTSTAAQQSLRMGFRYEPSPRWSGSFEWQRQLKGALQGGSRSMLLAQLRMRLQG